LANPEIPKRLLQLDEITRGDHFYIADDDLCFHLWAYVKGGLVTDHPSNQLIRNLQIPVDQRANVYRWRYKGRAIRYAADALSSVVPPDFFQRATWIPTPPSAAAGSPDHDPRLLEVLRAVRPQIPDVRELVFQNISHTSKEKGIPPETRAAHLEIDERFAYPPPAYAMIFDDVLAGGSHFKAMQMVLQRRFPGIQTAGLFLARTIRPDEPSAADLADFKLFLANWGKG